MTDEGKEIEVTLARTRATSSSSTRSSRAARARSRPSATSRSPKHFPRRALPVLIHGDAAFPGEGVVAETLNLEALDGYSTGGMIHIIANNQIGFTTEPEEARSTRYASDLAKGFDIPIIHVNADDPEACIAAVRLAMAYREEFKRGVVIDLIGYRRLGHNETDEPAYTQPLMYEQISKHPPVRKLYADPLVAPGHRSTRRRPSGCWRRRQDRLSRRTRTSSTSAGRRPKRCSSTAPQSEEPDTAYAARRAARAEPPSSSPIPRASTCTASSAPQREKRAEVGPDEPIDWGQAEALAFASLLLEGVPLRLTGQDSARGTFSQRHLMLVDAKTGKQYAPIQHLREAKAPFEIHNSPLSEAGALGFEYGYGVQAPEALVIWEAQFGDFVNAAQVIVDQFIVSGLAKWGETSRLTLLLPHGYEGAGPEHSSAAMERFLTLAAEGNIRVANVSTPAQYFHLLRRQALVEKRRPLIVFTPRACCATRSFSTLRELARGLAAARDRRPDAPRAARQGARACCSAPGASTTTSPGTSCTRERESRGRAGRAALPVPARGDRGPDRRATRT